MGTLILDEKMSYPITMKGMVICYDGILSKEELQECSKIEIRPINNGPYMSVITRPRVINYENKDGKTYFKLVSGSNENADAIRVNEVLENSPEVNLLKTVAQIAAQTFTDDQALMVKNIYDVWAPNVEYTKDTFFTYNGELYKVNQTHTSQSNWIPRTAGTESLYTKITLNESGYPIWQQPTGAHDAYNKGDIVEYNGELYISLIDGNAYSPDSYPDGWKKYIEE